MLVQFRVVPVIVIIARAGAGGLLPRLIGVQPAAFASLPAFSSSRITSMSRGAAPCRAAARRGRDDDRASSASIFSSVRSQLGRIDAQRERDGLTSRSPVIEDLLRRQVEERVARRDGAIVMQHLDRAGRPRVSVEAILVGTVGRRDFAFFFCSRKKRASSSSRLQPGLPATRARASDVAGQLRSRPGRLNSIAGPAIISRVFSCATTFTSGNAFV